MKLVPEICCTDLVESKQFYLDILRFTLKYERSEDLFMYLSLDGLDLMVEQISDKHRRWLTGEMIKPFGRGINFQWQVSDVDSLYQRVIKYSPENIYLDLETAEYRINDEIIKQKQFIVQDPDGYLFRFCD